MNQNTYRSGEIYCHVNPWGRIIFTHGNFRRVHDPGRHGQGKRMDEIRRDMISHGIEPRAIASIFDIAYGRSCQLREYGHLVS